MRLGNISRYSLDFEGDSLARHLLSGRGRPLN